MDATVLCQAAKPMPGVHTPTAEAVAAVPGVTTAVPTIGAYDTIATVTAPTPEGIAAIAVRVSELDAVGRTLTVVHVGGDA